MADQLPIFNLQYNNLKNSKGGRLAPQRDAIIRDNNFTELSNIASKHDRPDYLSGKKTFNAVVVYDYNSSAPPVGGTEIEGLFSALGENKKDTLKQVRAVIPDAHDLVIPLPTDLSAVRQDGEQQKYIALAPTFYSVDGALEGFGVGAVIEVEFTNNEYSEGKIVSVIKSAPTIDAKGLSAKDSFSNDQAGGDLSDFGTQTGDGSNVQVGSRATRQTSPGQCGGVSGYDKQDCYTANMTTTGQPVTLHEKFWKQMNDLITEVYNKEGYNIKIWSATRTESDQTSIRKSYCPEWQLLTSQYSEDQIMRMKWSMMNSAIKKINGTGCSNQTDSAAAGGDNKSNHLIGLAVDLVMGMGTGGCPSFKKDSSGAARCQQISKTYIFMNKYAASFGIKNNPDEPWHWSYNGR